MGGGASLSKDVCYSASSFPSRARDGQKNTTLLFLSFPSAVPLPYPLRLCFACNLDKLKAKLIGGSLSKQPS